MKYYRQILTYYIYITVINLNFMILYEGINYISTIFTFLPEEMLNAPKGSDKQKLNKHTYTHHHSKIGTKVHYYRYSLRV